VQHSSQMNGNLTGSAVMAARISRSASVKARSRALRAASDRPARWYCQSEARPLPGEHFGPLQILDRLRGFFEAEVGESAEPLSSCLPSFLRKRSGHPPERLRVAGPPPSLVSTRRRPA